jgi:DnaJ-class molecular chaperone
MPTFYETLEVSPRASQSVIRAAYRCLVQQVHPDKNPGSEVAARCMAEINRAYAVLSDVAKRQDYDRCLDSSQRHAERRGHGATTITKRAMPNGETPYVERPFAFRPLG